MVDHGQKRIKVIGFYGVAGVGKSTAANYTSAWFNSKGYSSHIRSFAGPLKDGLKEMGIEKDTHYDLYRRAAQYMGTEICRAEDENWWVEQMRKRIDSLPDGSIVVIDDCRFQNEFDYLKEIGADIIFVHCGARIDITDKVYEHASEAIAVATEKKVCTKGILFLNEVGVVPNYIIDNERTLDEMVTHLQRILPLIEEKWKDV